MAQDQEEMVQVIQAEARTPEREGLVPVALDGPGDFHDKAEMLEVLSGYMLKKSLWLHSRTSTSLRSCSKRTSRCGQNWSRSTKNGTRTQNRRTNGSGRQALAVHKAEDMLKAKALIKVAIGKEVRREEPVLEIQAGAAQVQKISSLGAHFQNPTSTRPSSSQRLRPRSAQLTRTLPSTPEQRTKST